MTYRMIFPALVAITLAACGNGTNPFTPEDATGDTGTSREGLLPGTTSPTASGPIQRYEGTTEDVTGSGSAVNYEYRAGSDTFYVDNLPFDGDNTYARGTTVSTLGGGAYRVYESDAFSTDPSTGATVANFTYRAIYGKSTSGGSEFAIVRSGSYDGYGFGGFIYQRNAQNTAGESMGLVVPACSGDCTAEYTGPYAGLRVFNGRSGMEYVQGDATMTIDFEDFNNGQPGAVLYVRNRRLYDLNGTEVTAAYLTALENEDTKTTIVNTGSGTYVPNLVSTVATDAGDSNGEFTADIGSTIINSDGSTAILDSGTYYAVLSGQNADEVVGVLVVESADPRVAGTKVQETGGFILYRR